MEGNVHRTPLLRPHPLTPAPFRRGELRLGFRQLHFADGAKIAFSTDRDGNYEIHIMNADGSNPIRLTHDAPSGPNDYSPDWSPDGSKIVFQSNRNSSLNQIWVMNADGSGLTRLTNGATDDINPAWSPDGSAIVFARAASGSSTYNLFAMNADGTSQTALTNGTGIGEVFNEPDWKP